MELKHSFTVPASVQRTWDTFMDLQLVGGCFPGATVTEVTDDEFAGSVKVKLGPIALVYSGTGSFLEKDEQTHTAVIKATGKDKRGNGTAGATVTITLTDEGGSTRADVATDLAITGKPAQFGRGVMQDVSDKLLGQFVSCIEGKLADAPTEPPTGAAGEAPVEPVATEAVLEGAVPAGTVADDAEQEATPVESSDPAPALSAAAAEQSASAPTSATRPSSARHAAKEDNALNGLALVPVVLKSLWHRLLVALRLRRREE